MIGLLISWGIPRPIARVILWAAAALIVAFSLMVWLDRRDSRMIADHEKQVENVVIKSGRSADEKMMVRKERREAAQQQERREFDNASHAIPREGLTRRQRLDLCIELRDAGTDTTVLSQCSDLHSGDPPGAVSRPAAQR